MTALRAVLLALGAAALTAACAAGQQAQTADEKPTLDGTYGSVGSMRLEGVAIHTPEKGSYPAAADVPMSIYLANTGDNADELTNVTSPAFPGGWDVVSTPSLGSSAAPASGGATSSGSPQRIAPGDAVGLGLQDLTPNGTGSASTLVLKGLAAKNAPLYPGMAVKITFTFRDAGQTTLTVPVQLPKEPNEQTLRPSYVPPSG